MALMAFLLPILALLAAFCINAAQVQLTRTQLTIATDASARAGGRAFSEHQTVEAAKTAASVTAALNNVDGEPLLVREDDSANEIEFGRTTQPDGDTGRYVFEKIPTSLVSSGEEVASAVRVSGRRDNGSLSGSVPFMIPGLLNVNEFDTSQLSVAMQVDRDIALILDRSGSMVPDLDFDWPSGTSPWSTGAKDAGVDAGLLGSYYNSYGQKRWYYQSGVNSMTYQQWAWEEHFGLDDVPTQPWQDLVEAVNAFLDVLETTSQEEQVSVASYATSATLDEWLQKNHSSIRTTVEDLNPGGWTAIGEGMQEGITTLQASAARPYAAKTLVVMTDGVENRGVSSLSVAQSAVLSMPLTIHTVTFGDGADEEAMQEVAAAGGGKHYHAADGDQLVAIFEEIANNLPTILTK